MALIGILLLVTSLTFLKSWLMDVKLLCEYNWTFDRIA